MLFGFFPETLMASSNSSSGTKIEIHSQIIVSGTVMSNDGIPLPGVNVLVKGTTLGTQTDFDGNYSINVNDGNAQLVFSYIGFVTQEITIGNRSEINVTMMEDIAALNEVLVVGYGKMKKSDITGAVSSVKAKDLAIAPVLAVTDALKGRVSGVDITSAGGSPGAAPQIRIRGNRSITATNQPLLVLDGIPFPGNLNDINTNDVQSIEVLKDASSTAIYGSRGANGVLLITTKRGLTGKTRVTLDSYYGITEIYGEIDTRNAEQYVQQRIDVAKYMGNYTSDQEVFQDWEWEAYQNGVDTNWMDYVFNTGNRQNHQISFSGGSEKTQFLVSGGFFNEEAVVPQGDYSRFNFRLNLDHQVSDWLKIGTSTNVTYSERNHGVYDDPLDPILDASISSTVINGLMMDAIRLSPLAQPYDENGELYVENGPQRNNTMNPVAKYLGEYAAEDEWIQVNPNFYGEVKFSNSLTYRLNLATSFRYNRTGNYSTPQYNYGAPAGASQTRDNIKDVLIENILTYNKSFDKHNIMATGLFSTQQNTQELLNANVQELPYNSQFHNLGSAQTIGGVGSDLQEWGLMSVMGRIFYSFDDKYLITATMRADGSSRLSEGNKWGYFPSAAIGWNITNEDFMSEQNTFDDLKLRLSFGRVGNTGISPYQTWGSLGRASYNFGANNAFGYFPEELANPNLNWEMTNTFNLGLDFSIANGRVSGSIEAYKQYTSDLILSRQLPPTSGFANILQNVGKTENNGFEITLNTTPISNSNGLNWSSDLTAAYNREKIVELYNGTEDDIGNRWFIGQPINSWYYYESAGVWQENEATEAASYNQIVGTTKVKDQNNDGVISAEDRVVLGSPTPRWVVGWNNTFNYKNFDLTVFAVARLNLVIHDGYSDYLTTIGPAQDIHNGLNRDYWRPDNPINTRPAESDHTLLQFSKANTYVNGDFLKIRDINLGYTLNKENIPRLPFESLRIYVGVNNAIIFKKKLDGITIDTESDSGDIYHDFNNRINVPPLKTFSIGVNVNF